MKKTRLDIEDDVIEIEKRKRIEEEDRTIFKKRATSSQTTINQLFRRIKERVFVGMWQGIFMIMANHLMCQEANHLRGWLSLLQIIAQDLSHLHIMR